MHELETEREMTRAAVADYLREFADQLDGSTRTDDAPSGFDVPTTDATPTDSAPARTDDRERARDGDDAGGKITLMVGNDSATINPPGTLGFEVDVETDDSFVGSDAERSVEFTLTWDAEAVEQDDELDVS